MVSPKNIEFMQVHDRQCLTRRLTLSRTTGCEDLLLPTENSILMWRMLSHAGAHLHLYPDSGHAFLFQHARQFANLVNDFLDNPQERPGRL